MGLNFEVAIAATLRPCVNRFADIRRVYEWEGLPVPESVEDGWLKLQRVRDYAECELAWFEIGPIVPVVPSGWDVV